MELKLQYEAVKGELKVAETKVQHLTETCATLKDVNNGLQAAINILQCERLTDGSQASSSASLRSVTSSDVQSLTNERAEIAEVETTREVADVIMLPLEEETSLNPAQELPEMGFLDNEGMVEDSRAAQRTDWVSSHVMPDAHQEDVLLLTERNGEVYMGRGHYISVAAWESIRKVTKPTIFVNHLVVALIGEGCHQYRAKPGANTKPFPPGIIETVRDWLWRFFYRSKKSISAANELVSGFKLAQRMSDTCRDMGPIRIQRRQERRKELMAIRNQKNK
ncbi:uncharacterized protein LOC124162314 [Ischnura elegans]|nr:uncharacterized protein LOC124162314 [Ischnura elegans]